MWCGFVVDRRVRSTSRNERLSVDVDLRHTYRPKSTSLEREKGFTKHRSRLPSNNAPHSTQFDRISGSTTANPMSEEDPRWIKRQIHLPVNRQRWLKPSADVKRLDEKFQAGRGLVISSRSDPDNVCFSQKTAANMAASCVVVPAGTVSGQHLVCRTPSNVHVRFARDDNGNLVKVLPFDLNILRSCMIFGSEMRTIAIDDPVAWASVTRATVLLLTYTRYGHYWINVTICFVVGIIKYCKIVL